MQAGANSSSAWVDFSEIPIQQQLNESDAAASSFGRSRRDRRELQQRAHPKANGRGVHTAQRSRSRRGWGLDNASTGATVARNTAADLDHGENMLDYEEFDPMLLEAHLSQRATSSASAPSRWGNVQQDDRDRISRHLSPPRATPRDVGLSPQDLPELYVELVQRGRNGRFCLQCNQSFQAGQLQLGYIVDTLFPSQPARWIHVDCAQDARLRIQAASTRVSMNPGIPEAVCQVILGLLKNMSLSPGTTEVRKWNYLAAAVKRWDTYLIPGHEVHEQPVSGDELSQKREREVSSILALLPSYPLDVDLSEDDPCAVCQVPMHRGDMICRLPCHHVYHVGCIDTWLRVKTTCPLDNLCIADMLESLPESNASEHGEESRTDAVVVID